MDKETLYKKRQELFNEMISNLKKRPSKVDVLLEQDKYYVKPTEIYSDYKNGSLIFKSKGYFFNKFFELAYSVWQTGNIMKVGVRVQGELVTAFINDPNEEIYQIWSSQVLPVIDMAHGGMFFDWELDVTDIYEDYRSMERYIQGLRHLYIRTLRIAYDELKKKDQIDEEDIESYKE